MDPQRELRKLFAGLVEQAFYADIGICLPSLTDYLSDMLADFLHVDEIYRMRAAGGEPIRDLSRVRADADLGPDVDQASRVRVVNKYIGDFALFWTGMYPETLRPRRHYGVDRVREYTLQGKRGYGIASALSDAGDVPPGELLRVLSEQFESCAAGLYLVRKSWEQLTRQPRHN